MGRPAAARDRMSDDEIARAGISIRLTDACAATGGAKV
jgi:hypothetical protein